MKKIVLHVGAGKCGSSALQAYFSRFPVLMSTGGQKIIYGAVGINGFIATGNSIIEKARSSIFQYSSSVLLSNTVDKHFSANLKKSIQSIDAEVLVLSCEGWLGQAQQAAEKLQCTGEYDVDVVVYVRPPVEWLNSAWWQWGAWTGTKFNQWLSRSVENTFWSEYVKVWSHVEFVDNVIVRNLSTDVVGDFQDVLSIPSELKNDARSNTSLPGSVLRLFQQFSELRPSAHEPQIDFTVSRRLSEISSKPDWIISSKQITEVLEASRKYNDDLLCFMSSSQRETTLSNPAWWDENYYNTKDFQDPGVRAISESEKNNLMYHSIVSLHQAESEIISLRNKVRELSNKNKIE